jgi:hypothetical protein
MEWFVVWFLSGGVRLVEFGDKVVPLCQGFGCICSERIRFNACATLVRGSGHSPQIRVFIAASSLCAARLRGRSG